ncbi:hypothetical protein PR048_011640 [Dryococelus australis]|uniref:Uncharacterized protein n=1 Tax=Dryococelus australis TaxID=614101 RepID=A0ABQ9HNF5_9NEOP|nr:hypothetical protein PR048_011640 [Dryococelus australis]
MAGETPCQKMMTDRAMNCRPLFSDVEFRLPQWKHCLCNHIKECWWWPGGARSNFLTNDGFTQELKLLLMQ